MQKYDANSIKILSSEEAQDRFEWLKAEELAAQYSTPLICVQRGLEACRVTDTDPQHYIDRYLKYNKTVPKNETLELAYIELMKPQKKS